MNKPKGKKTTIRRYSAQTRTQLGPLFVMPAQVSPCVALDCHGKSTFCNDLRKKKLINWNLFDLKTHSKFYNSI